MGSIDCCGCLKDSFHFIENHCECEKMQLTSQHCRAGVVSMPQGQHVRAQRSVVNFVMHSCFSTDSRPRLQVSTPTAAGARSSKFRRQKSFAELYGDDSLDDSSPTTPGTDVVLVRPLHAPSVFFRSTCGINDPPGLSGTCSSRRLIT